MNCVALALPDTRHFVTQRGVGVPKYGKTFTHFSYANPKAPKGGTISFYTGKWEEASGLSSSLGLSLQQQPYVYAQLMKVPKDNIAVAYPYVASAVQILPQSKGVCFYLNSKSKFHDGTPITAQDIKFTFNLLSKEGDIRFKALAEQVRSVQEEGPHKVKFMFKDRNPELPFWLSQMFILSKKHTPPSAFKALSQSGGLMGSGPYQIDKSMKKKYVSFKRVKDWWGESLPSQCGFYNFDSVKIHYFGDSRVAFESFKKGMLDWWKDERISNWLMGYNFKAVKEGQIIRKAYKKPFYHGLTGLFINTRNPCLRHAAVRQGLNLLFNFDWLNKSLFYGRYQRNQSVFMNSGYGALPRITKAEKEEAKKLGIPEEAYSRQYLPAFKNTGSGYDKEQKRKVLDLFRKGGWILKDGVMYDQKKPVRLDLLVFAKGHHKIFKNYVETLKSFGISCDIKGGEVSSYMKKLSHFEYDLVFYYYPHVSVPGPEQEFFWSSKWQDQRGSLNLSGVKDEYVDRLTEAIHKSHNRHKLKIYTSLLDRIIRLGYYLIPAWAPPLNYVAYWNKVECTGVPASLYDTDTFWACER